MKRMIKANEQTEFRVVSIGLDVVIPAEADGSEIADKIELLLDEHAKGFRCAIADFKGDVTDLYESEYPGDLFID